MVRVLNVYYSTRAIVLLLCEAMIISGCFLLATVIILGRDAFIELDYHDGMLKLAFITLITLLCSYYFDLYEPQMLGDRREIYFRVFFVAGFLCLFLSGIFAIFPNFDMAQYIMPLGFALLTATLLVWRRTYEWLLTKNLFRECVYVLGGGPYAQSVVDTIQSRPDIGVQVFGWSGICADKDERRQLNSEAVARMNRTSADIDRIIVAMEERRGELPAVDLLALRFRGVVVEEASAFLERLSGKISLDNIRPSSFLFTEGFRVRPSQQMTRRLVAVLVAAAGLLLFAPFFPLVALGVRLSGAGPIFFRQTRVGLGGKTFTLYKFRSMVQNAEADGAQWAARNDARVTSFGKFMRKTRIDEIPQLWNVLRGDMGLVGPRPERPEFVPWLAERLPFYDLRHMIRPGLTGWAQVRFKYGATLEDSREKLEYDLYYIKHISVGLDLLIMFETIKTIVRRRGAQ